MFGIRESSHLVPLDRDTEKTLGERADAEVRVKHHKRGEHNEQEYVEVVRMKG